MRVITAYLVVPIAMTENCGLIVAKHALSASGRLGSSVSYPCMHVPIQRNLSNAGCVGFECSGVGMDESIEAPYTMMSLRLYTNEKKHTYLLRRYRTSNRFLGR